MDQHPISFSPYCSHQIGYKPRWGAHKRRVCGQLSSGASRFLFCLSFPGAFFVGIVGSGSATFTFHYPVSFSLSTFTFHILRITVTGVCFVGIVGSGSARHWLGSAPLTSLSLSKREEIVNGKKTKGKSILFKPSSPNLNFQFPSSTTHTMWSTHSLRLDENLYLKPCWGKI